MARQKWEAVDEKFKLGCENYTHRQFISTAMLIAKTWQLYMHEKIRNMMDRVQEINFAFSYSAERTHQFRASLEATPHQLEKRSKLRKLCETRWSAKVDDLYTFMASFDVFVGALSNLIGKGNTKTQSHLNNMLSFPFFICLVTAEQVIADEIYWYWRNS